MLRSNDGEAGTLDGRDSASPQGKLSAATMQLAGRALLPRAVDARRWTLAGRRVTKDNLCTVGRIRVCATVDVTPTLETFLRVSFFGPGLSPMQAAEYLEQVLGERFVFVPNAEWLVEIDARDWIHFSRHYTRPHLVS